MNSLNKLTNLIDVELNLEDNYIDNVGFEALLQSVEWLNDSVMLKVNENNIVEVD